MARKLFDIGVYDALNANGSFASGATLAFYAAGSTTPIITYNAPSAGSANANPVVADAYGRFDEIWIDTGQTIKYVFTSYSGATPISVDNVSIDAASETSIAAGLLDFLAGDEPLPIANGGTASTTAAAARTALGISDIALSASAAALGALANTANQVPYMTGSDAWAKTSFPAFGRTLVGQSTAAAAIAALTGLGLPANITFGTNTISASIVAPNGDVLLIQGGVGSLGADTTGTITFGTAYTVAPVCIVGGGSSNVSHEGEVHASAAASTTSIAICNSNGSIACTYTWLAIGKG